MPPQPDARFGDLELWTTGQVVAGLYEVKGLLGKGGMGAVYRVRHREWGVDLAVKRPAPRALAVAGGAERFVREAETWVKLPLHPHIVTAYYVRVVSGSPAVFAECVEGGDLLAWIEEERLAGLPAALDAAIQVAWGMAAAHAHGLVHRDLKPANVLMGPGGAAKVTDFGLARPAGSGEEGPAGLEAGGARLTSVGAQMGTPPYMPPEQWMGQAVGPAADVYAFGAMLYELLCGRWPFAPGPELDGAPGPARKKEFERLHLWEPPPDPAAWRPDLPPGLADLMRACLDKDPARRPAGFAELAARLAGFYEEAAGAAYPRRDPGELESRAVDLNNRALSMLDLGKRDEARELLREALAADPQHAEATYNYAVLKWQEGSLDDTQVVKRLADLAADPSRRAAAERLLAVVRARRGEGPACRMGCARVLEGHRGYVVALAAAPGGRRAVSASLDKTLRLWDLDSGACLRELGGLEASPFAAVSADGRHALAQGVGGGLSFWDLADGRCALRVEGHARSAAALSLAPDGRRAVSVDEGGELIVWELSPGTPPAAAARLKLPGAGRARAVAVSPDGRHALCGGEDGTSRAWDLASGRLALELKGHRKAVSSVAWAPGGRQAVSGSWDDTVRVWDLASGKCLRVLEGHSTVTSVAVSPDGGRLLSGGLDKTVRLWDLARGVCLRTFDGHAGSVYAVAFASASRALSAGADKTVRVWDLAERLPPVPPAFARFVSSEEAAATKRRVDALRDEAERRARVGELAEADAALRRARAVPGYGKDPALLELADGLLRRGLKRRLASFWVQRSLRGHPGPVSRIALSPDETVAVTAGADGVVRLWELGAGRILGTWNGREWSGGAFAFLPDGRLLVAGLDGALRVAELPSEKISAPWGGAAAAVAALAVSHDGRLALSAGDDGVARLWDVASGRLTGTFEGHGGAARAAAFSPDGRLSATGGEDGAVRLWDLADGACLRRLEGHEYGVLGLAFAGNRLISAAGDQTLRVWDYASGSCLRVLDEGAGVPFVQATGEGRFILSGAHGKTELRLRALDGEGTALRLDGHTKPVACAALSASGRYVVSGGEDALIQVWRLDWELEFPGSAST